MECELIGRLCGAKWERCIDMVRRVYSVEGLAPTILTFSGGNTEAKILESQSGLNPAEEINNRLLPVNGNKEMAVKIPSGSRIRKLTEWECFRLMGVKDDDYKRIAQNQSKSSLYHLAGDSIVTNVLSAIFAEMI